MNEFKCRYCYFIYLFCSKFKSQLLNTWRVFFSFFTCVLWKNKQKLKKNKTCIYYQNHQSSIYYLKKYTQYVYIYTVNHIVLSLMINKSTTNRMQCYSLIRILISSLKAWLMGHYRLMVA